MSFGVWHPVLKNWSHHILAVWFRISHIASLSFVSLSIKWGWQDFCDSIKRNVFLKDKGSKTAQVSSTETSVRAPKRNWVSSRSFLGKVTFQEKRQCNEGQKWEYLGISWFLFLLLSYIQNKIRKLCLSPIFLRYSEGESDQELLTHFRPRRNKYTQSIWSLSLSRGLCFHCRGDGFNPWLLVGHLRSCMLHGTAKNIKINFKNKFL